jgi:hypothetical protein
MTSVVTRKTAVSCNVCGGTQKFPDLKKKYLKYLYKFETLVPFEVLPLRLDAAIPAPLPMLETLSKIFIGNTVKGRQRFATTYWLWLPEDSFFVNRNMLEQPP